jgi:hypothetical protein
MLYVFGVLVMSLAVVVYVLNTNASTDLLASVGLLGGVAIIVNQLPTENHRRRNGDDKDTD